jgi:hypothetical protein
MVKIEDNNKENVLLMDILLNKQNKNFRKKENEKQTKFKIKLS